MIMARRMGGMNAQDLRNFCHESRKQRWQTSTAESILQNEKYKGAALLQKCFMVDFLTKRGRSMRARCRSIMWNTAMSHILRSFSSV